MQGGMIKKLAAKTVDESLLVVNVGSLEKRSNQLKLMLKKEKSKG